MTEFLQISTTTGTVHDAEQIAAELITRRLAGCVQISGPITSIYRWQGNAERSEEWVCTIKTSSEQLTKVQQVIEELHPYDTPEVIATPIVAGSPGYLDWLREQMQG